MIIRRLLTIALLITCMFVVATVAAVYGGGVWGHDHLVDGPGGKEFNIAWEPMLVLFTNSAAANQHITTDAELDAAIRHGDVMPPIPLPQFTFLCAVVPAATYNH